MVHDRHRAIATSPGVDLVVAARHCFAAETLEAIRDALLALLAVASVLWGWFAAADGYSWRDLFVVGGLAWLLGSALVFWHLWLVEVRTVARRMRRGTFDPDAAPPPGSAVAAQAISEVGLSQGGNARVYSGFWPFVGSGLCIGGWSFALDVEKGSTRFGAPCAPEPVEVPELYDRLTGSLSELDLDGLAVSDRVFVNGRDLRREAIGEPRAFTRPGMQLTEDLVAEIASESAVRVRHYRCVEVVAWEGQLVLSIFLRLQRTGRTLFVEASYSLLPPLRDPFMRVDSFREDPDFLQRVGMAARAGAIAPPALLLAVPRTFVRAAERLLRPLGESAARRRVRRDPTLDRGASVSVREIAQSRDFQRWFQALDREMYVKVIERRLLDALAEFLDEKGVDTSDLRERETTILNSGVIMTGGAIQGTSIAMGQAGHAFTREGSRTPGLARRAAAPRASAPATSSR